MEERISKPLLIFFIVRLLFYAPFALSLSSTIQNTFKEHENYTGISQFRVLNWKTLFPCSRSNTGIRVGVSPDSNLPDDGMVTVTVTGVSEPLEDDWVAMISPSKSNISGCPLSGYNYAQTGDLSHLPLLCHYPVKAQLMRNDPGYLSCKNGCKGQKEHGKCTNKTCSGSIKFHVINIRTDIEFVLFGNGFNLPCILSRTGHVVNFANPRKPLHGHLSSIDSTATSMRLTWVSGDKEPQEVVYGRGKRVVSNVSTFSQENMCSSVLPSPARDFGWHDPGYIHSTVMTGLKPSTTYTYRYGSKSVGWSDDVQFRTPPAGGSNKLKFIAYGDMGKAPRDHSVEHYIQPGSLSVTRAISDEIRFGKVDTIFHIGDISYATGFLVEWDYFLNLISPVASKVPYMTAIGNHERDYVNSGSVYLTPDSGGECGVPYETYFPMPTPAKDKPWYSIEQGPVHFTVMSTEHDWSTDSEQYGWMKKDLASIDRSRTPWSVFTGHRPMYSSSTGLFTVDKKFLTTVEPLLLKNKVDLVLFGHVHNYERTCSVYKSKCLAMPRKNRKGIDTYDHSNYTAPVQAIIGMAGFKLDNFTQQENWSLSRISKYGYLRGHATRHELKLELVTSDARRVEDSFCITKNAK